MTEARENWIDLSGKTSVVTGASGGLGVALVWEMAALGAAVAMVDLRTDGLVSLGEEIGQAGGRAGRRRATGCLRTSMQLFDFNSM